MARSNRDEGKERYWRRVLTQWQASQPTTVRAFCVAQGISQPLFYWWRREIQRRDRERPQFLPVHVVGETLAPESNGSAIHLEMDDDRSGKTEIFSEWSGCGWIRRGWNGSWPLAGAVLSRFGFASQ